MKKRQKRICYLDMDGTIYPLYDIPNWEPRLRAEDATVFDAAKPMIEQEKLLKQLQDYHIIILSMTPKEATKEYCEKVIAVKNAWLDKFFPALKERIYIPYGNCKNVDGAENAVLIDDNETIRNGFKGKAFPPLW